LSDPQLDSAFTRLNETYSWFQPSTSELLQAQEAWPHRSISWHDSKREHELDLMSKAIIELVGVRSCITSIFERASHAPNITITAWDPRRYIEVIVVNRSWPATSLARRWVSHSQGSSHSRWYCHWYEIHSYPYLQDDSIAINIELLDPKVNSESDLETRYTESSLSASVEHQEQIQEKGAGTYHIGVQILPSGQPMQSKW